MAVIWSDGMSYSGGEPNFERDYYKHLHTNNPATGEPWETTTDPVSGEEVPVTGMLDVKKGNLPDMFLATCLETCKIYLYRKKKPDGTNRKTTDDDVDPVLGFWSEVGSAELGGILKFNTIAVMALYIPKSECALAYCVEDEKTYIYLESNESLPTTGKWREFVSGGSTERAKVSVNAIEEYESGTTDISGYADEYIWDITNDLVYFVTKEWIETSPAQGNWEMVELTELPTGETAIDVEDITNVSDPVQNAFYHDTTADKYYQYQWIEETPAQGHYEYHTTDVTGAVTIERASITELLYNNNLTAEQKQRDIVYYVD